MKSAKQKIRDIVVAASSGTVTTMDILQYIADNRLGLQMNRFLMRKTIDSFMRKSVVFIHVPRNAGTSISDTLYGHQVYHFSISHIRALLGNEFERLDSFSMIRDPVERFVSSFKFLRAGGTSNVPVVEYWHRKALGCRSLSEYVKLCLDLGPGIKNADFTMRPQSNFICTEDGKVDVKHIFSLQGDQGEFLSYLNNYSIYYVPVSNNSTGENIFVSEENRQHIEKIYEKDKEIWAAFCKARKDICSSV